MLETLKQYIEQKKLIAPDDQILVAVSGGLDSMVLLHLLYTAGYKLGVAHCNFQLRGAESDGDEHFVKQYCARLGIPFFCTRFDTNNYATEHKLSIQMAARDLRYAWFNELLKKQGFAKLATAHHFSDSIETVLLNWAKGGGTESLRGIAPQRGNIIRPLLFATREQINQYAADNEITWREDISNQTDDYQRNFIRHQVIPQLKRINVSLENTLLASSWKIDSELAFLDKQYAAWKAANCEEVNGTLRIAKKVLTDHTIAASLLWRSVRELNLSFEMCEEVIQSLHAQSGKQFFSSTHRLVIDRDFLIITVITNHLPEVMIEYGQTEVTMGKRRLKIAYDVPVKPVLDSHVAVLDFEKTKFPLCWRTWKAGDYFHPLGMEQPKKLSDFLIDNKISLAEKDEVTVLESNGEIVWVVGYRIDNRFKLTTDTQKAICFILEL